MTIPCARSFADTPAPDTWQAERAAAAMREMTREARDLRRRAGELSTPSTFAQSAKLARAAVAKEREVEHLRAGQANLRRRGPALAKAALQLSAVAALWGGPVLRAPGPPLGWPLDVLLAARQSPDAAWGGEAGGGVGFGTGAIGALPFAVLCGRVASLLARVVLPP